MKKYFLHKNAPYFIAILLALVLSLNFFLPAVPKLTTQFIGDGGDNYEYASYMMLFEKNLTEQIDPLASTDFWRYPSGFEFSRSFDSHIAVGIGGILNLFLSNILSYNLTILMLATLNGVFSFIYFKYLTRSNLLGLAGMVMYGFSFYTLGKAESHLNLMFVGGFPFLAYSVLRIIKVEKITAFETLLFFGSLLLLILGSKQYFLMALFFLIAYGVIASIFYPKLIKETINKLSKAIIPILGSLLAFSLTLAIIFNSYLTAAINHKFYVVGRDKILNELTPSIWDFILPNHYFNLLSNFIHNPSKISIESVVFLGWIEIALFLAFFFIKKYNLKLKVFVFVLFLIPFTLALGYGAQNSFPLLPMRFLRHFSFFEVFSEASRFYIVFYLIVTSVVCLTLINFQKFKNVFTLFIAIIIFTLLLERTPVQIKTASSLNDPYTEVVKNQDTKAVVDIPVNPYYPRYNILSFYYDKAIVNGYFHWSSDGPSENEFLTYANLTKNYMCTNGINDLSNDDIDTLNKLKTAGINIVVIHKDDKFFHKVCEGVRIKLSRIIPNVEVLEETSEQKQFTTNMISGYPNYKFYFPKSGKFYLDGVYFSPDSKANINIELNGTSIPVDYTWQYTGNPNAIELFPKNELTLDVEKGSTLTFFSNDLVNNAYFSVWYRYEPISSEQIPYIAPIEYIYRSSDTDVLRIN